MKMNPYYYPTVTPLTRNKHDRLGRQVSKQWKNDWKVHLSLSNSCSENFDVGCHFLFVWFSQSVSFRLNGVSLHSTHVKVLQCWRSRFRFET